MRAGLRGLAYLAAAKIALAPLAYALALGTETAPPLVHLAHVLAWTSAAALLLANRGDRRAVTLGTSCLVVGAMFADPAIRHHVASPLPALSWLALTLASLAPDAFLPATAWLFVRDFPTLERPRGDRVADTMIRASILIGALLFLANVGLRPALPWLGPDARHSLLVGILDRSGMVSSLTQRALGGYWAAMFALLLPVWPLALWKARFARRDERRRVWRFLIGIAVGSIPPLVIFLLAEVVAPLGRMLAAPKAAATVFWTTHALLLSVPFTTAYAVVVDRTLEVRLVVRLALRYALARYALVAACVTPLVLLAAFLYQSRDSTLAELFSTTGAPMVVGLAGAAGLALSARSRLLEALDRRFFRERYDARRILAQLVESTRRAESSGAVARLVEHETDRALHLDAVALFALDPAQEYYRCPGRDLPALEARSPLARFLEGSAEPLDVDLEDPHSVLRRLPQRERHWLADSRTRLLVPLLGTSGRLVGLIALGSRKSEQPFLPEDLLLLKAVAGSIALPIEDRLARESPAGFASPGTIAARPAGDPPAADCMLCGTVHPPGRRACDACGGPLGAAMLPCLLLGKFRLERRIGAGGMGVVYLATDLSLGRPVAIKTLPKIAPEYASRLRREARAAAAVLHPNLATIFGAETWMGTPALVFEYLSGGTLLQRMDGGRLSVVDSLKLGVAIAAALERAHGARILHRDIKPSNIGYAADGTPKLLDFGLAHIFDDWRSGLGSEVPDPFSRLDTGSSPALIETVELGRSASRLTPAGTLMGTLPYLSPEAIAGAPPAPSFDLWAAALVVYEALTGVNPLIGPDVEATLSRIRSGEIPDPRERAPGCPEVLASLLLRALDADPRARPRTAADLRRELDRLYAPLAGGSEQRSS